MRALGWLYDRFDDFPFTGRRIFWRIWHSYLLKYDKQVDANFMNYGYSGLNGEKPIELKEEDEINRYCIQLYDHVVETADLKGKHVLEVGSGRGGGADYITRYYKPGSYTALDISTRTIDFCNKHYKHPELKFVKGNAEKLPFAEKTFDIVINVESARNYKNLQEFFKGVHRILKPGGYFLFADMMFEKDVADMPAKLEESGFRVTKKEHITPNVIRALQKDSERREVLIQKHLPGFLNKSFSQFAGTKGSERYESFENGTFQYWSYVLQA
ncbi:MAG: class I SAM-dependent methyltransferase [Bacteroidales bacterium]|nr:class I SAM-dependent methyltransferase [Bacteroidales bacterium]